MIDTPIISIVVPTKNRHRYVAALLESLTRMRSRDFEVVVHDNSEDNGEYQRLCGAIADPRVRYFHDPAPMAMTANCEKAIDHSRGAFVCMIGDDDGVTETIVDVAHWLKSQALDAAIAPVPTYYWPGVGGVLDSNTSQGMLRLPRYSGKIDIVAESSALDFVLRSGGIRIGDLPSVYQAVISRRALDALKLRAGTYFPGPSPDMASAAGLSAVMERFARVDLPVVISGTCPSSGAAEGVRHRHEGEISERKFLAADTAAHWPAQVPFYFSGVTLLAASLIRALALTGRNDLSTRIRFDRLLAACMVFNPGYRDRVRAVRLKHPTLVSPVALFGAVGWVWWQRAKALSGNLRRKLFSRGNAGRQVTGLQHIGEVVEHVGRRFDERVRVALAQRGYVDGRSTQDRASAS